jgi:hypothetical protein
MPITSVISTPSIPKANAPTQAARRARRDAPQSAQAQAPRKPASGSVQQVNLTIPFVPPRAKKVGLLGTLLGRKPKDQALERGRLMSSGHGIDRSRKIFIGAEAYQLGPQLNHAIKQGSGEYMGSVLVGSADAAGLAHFSHALHVLEALDTIMLEIGYLRKPKLTPSQAGVLRRMSEANPVPEGMTPGVWLTVGQAMDMDLPPSWYEDPDNPLLGRWVTPVENGKRRLDATNEQRYALSKAMATNTPRPA